MTTANSVHRRREPLRVLVVEDSMVQRAFLVRMFEADDEISVVGAATGATEAIELVQQLRPDVVTLDLKIPQGGGQYVVEQVMATNPTPILVLSATINGRTSAPAVEALASGAVEALPKPARWTQQDRDELVTMVKAMRGMAVIRHPRGRLATSRRVDPPVSPEASGSGRVVAIAASTGGPPALAEVLGGLSGLAASVLVVQHLHDDFVDGLVTWMARTSVLPVKLARDGENLANGTVYIAPPGHHLKVGPGRTTCLSTSPATIHRPSADELFRSVARHAGASGIGVVLTGMGSDGAEGLGEMLRAGGKTIGQDAQTCAVYGMPRAAALAGALSTVSPLPQIAGCIVRAASGVRA